MKYCKPLIAAVVGVMLTQQSHAGFVFGYGNATVNQSFTGILGDNFSVSTPIIVNQLGVFSQDAPAGLSIPIAIYQHTGSDPASGWNLVGGTSTIIVSGDPVDVGSQTTYTGITPVTLGPGLYSIVTVTSSDYNSGNPNLGPSAVTFDPLGGAVSLGGYDIWNYGTTLGTSLSGLYTTGPTDPNWPWPLPVFGAGTFSATPVPEPTTMVAGALLLLPFGLSTLRMFRKSRTA